VEIEAGCKQSGIVGRALLHRDLDEFKHIHNFAGQLWNAKWIDWDSVVQLNPIVLLCDNRGASAEPICLGNLWIFLIFASISSKLQCVRSISAVSSIRSCVRIHLQQLSSNLELVGIIYNSIVG